MEKIIKIENKESARELICDLCNQLLNDEFYATFWTEKRGTYLEKYICPSCYQGIYYKTKRAIPFDKAEENLKAAIEKNLQQKHYGIVTPFDSWEELQMYLENPDLMKKRGKII